MDSVSKHVSFLVLTSFLSGCAFSPVTRPNPAQYLGQFRQQDTFSDTVENGTDAAKATIEALGWEILTTNPDLGLARSKTRKVIIPDVCDCGSWNGGTIAGTADGVLVVNLESKGQNESTVKVSLECVTNFTGRNLHGATTRQETYACASRGIVEGQFLDTFSRVLSAASKRKK